MTDYTLEQLEAKIGQKVWYKGAWGHEKPELAVLTNVEFDDDKNDIVVDVDCENGHSHWGYVYQITFIE